MEQKKALLLCQSNLVMQSEESSLQEVRLVVDNMIVNKKFAKDGRLITMVVSVQKKDAEKEIVTLSKSFLIGR